MHEPPIRRARGVRMRGPPEGLKMLRTPRGKVDAPPRQDRRDRTTRGCWRRLDDGCSAKLAEGAGFQAIAGADMIFPDTVRGTDDIKAQMENAVAGRLDEWFLRPDHLLQTCGSKWIRI